MKEKEKKLLNGSNWNQSKCQFNLRRDVMPVTCIADDLKMNLPVNVYLILQTFYTEKLVNICAKMKHFRGRIKVSLFGCQSFHVCELIIFSSRDKIRTMISVFV